MHICIDCKNGYANKCSWVAYGREPDGVRRNKKTGRIQYCPNFEKEKSKSKVKKAGIQVKICPGCGKRFIPHVRQARYCSATCRNKAAQRRFRANKK